MERRRVWWPLVFSAALWVACTSRQRGESEITDGPPDAAAPFVPQVACFAAGTQVATPQGMRPIEGLSPGDTVLSYDIAEGRLRQGKVTALWAHPAQPVGRLDLEDGRVLRVTDEHPIFALDL